MTQEEKTELSYLMDLILESSKWKIEDGQDAIRLEVEDRINRILDAQESTGEVKVEGVLDGDDYKALEAARLNEHLASPDKVDQARKEWESGRVRVKEGDKFVWRPVNLCHKEPMYPDNPWAKKFRWVYDGPKESG